MICMLMHMFGQRHEAQSPYGPAASWSSPESAQDILDRRYASGEITRETYEQLRRTLNTQKGNR